MPSWSGCSADHAAGGEGWEVVTTLPASDKEWFALDDDSIWVGFLASGTTHDYHRVAFDGSSLGSAQSPATQGVVGVSVDASGAHFIHHAAVNGTDMMIVRWDGTTTPTREGELLPIGAGAANGLYHSSAVGLGVTSTGAQWIVRSVHRDGAPTIVLRVRALPDEGVDQPISEPGQSAFLPAAIVDEDGRMHVVYYDSGGAVGVLRHTRSSRPTGAKGSSRRR